MRMAVPAGPTYRTGRTSTVIDYYLLTKCLSEQTESVTVLHQFPLRPHSPVQVNLKMGVPDKMPVLQLPPRLPLEVPFGPAREPRDWSSLGGLVEEAKEYMKTHRTSQPERLQVLDHVYSTFVQEFEVQISEATDTPRRQRSRRGEGPSIRWVDSTRRAREHFKSWRNLVRPLHWLTQWTNDVLRYIEDSDSNATAHTLAEDLRDHPAEFQEVEALINIYHKATMLIQALSRNEAAGQQCQELNRSSFTDLQDELQRAVEEERHNSRKTSLQAWRDWVADASSHNRGWAHRWTKLQDVWKPTRARIGGTYTGKPIDVLKQERERLMGIWGCQRRRAAIFEATAADHEGLPPLTAEQGLRAACSFPRRTAQTWDGFHPRHFSMLKESQLEIVMDVLEVVELLGMTPSNIQAVYAKLIPKHTGNQLEQISMRGIGLLPSLYRLWARLRQTEARRWEKQHRTPLMGHQAGRSIMEVVFMQGLRAESGQQQEPRVHTGAFIWDLLNFYEHLNRQKLWDRACSTGFSKVVAAVALNQYSTRRFIGLEDLALPCDFPERGIVAGCGLATTWVQVYSLEPLQVWQTASPQVGLTIFIDDLFSHSEDQAEHKVVGHLAAGAASLHVAIEHNLECRIAP